MMARLKLNPAKMQLLVVFFETYLRLGKQEEAELATMIHELAPKEESEIMELYTSWELKGMKKGKKQGKLEGIQQGKLEGIQQGKLEGIQQGKLEGERLAKLELAHKLLAEGLVSLEKIVELTGLSKEDILNQH